MLLTALQPAPPTPITTMRGFISLSSWGTVMLMVMRASGSDVSGFAVRGCWCRSVGCRVVGSRATGSWGGRSRVVGPGDRRGCGRAWPFAGGGRRRVERGDGGSWRGASEMLPEPAADAPGEAGGNRLWHRCQSRRVEVRVGGIGEQASAGGEGGAAGSLCQALHPARPAHADLLVEHQLRQIGRAHV